jgi:hypothetical protein
MTQRGWYLRRAVPWTALLGCCAAAVATALLLERWPSTSLILLPALLACCAAAAGFVFDEVALAVVEVTPRGSAWRRTARLAVAVVPLGLCSAVVWVRPGDLMLGRAEWLLVGAAVVAASAGAAGMASRAVATPGGLLASAAAIILVAPVVVTGFLGWESLYPGEDFAEGAGVVWLTVAGLGLLACAVALRPGLRR